MRNRGEKIKAEIEKSLPPTEVIRFSAEKYEEHLKVYVNTATTEHKLDLSKTSNPDIFRKRQEIAISIIASNTKLVMEGIVDIANSWTKQRHGELKYSANIFSVIDKNDHDTSTETILNHAIKESPFFLYTDSLASRLSFCDKLIISQQEFSTCNQARTSQGKPLVLPYSDTIEASKRYHPNFEGAPTAIEKRQARYIPDTKKVAQLFFDRIQATNHADHITQHYKNCISSYYKKDNTQSLLSIPMYNDDKEVFAILNIYSETKDMLSSKERAHAFYQFIRPHIAILEFMINKQIYIASLAPTKVETSLCNVNSWKEKFDTHSTVDYNVSMVKNIGETAND